MIDVNTNGLTEISSKIAATNIQVTIVTHEVAIKEAGRGKVHGTAANCTFSKIPCSLVDDLKINVGGSQLFIPRSLFADLSDLRRASLERKGDEMKLTLHGGDASESFVVNIDFTALRVKHRDLWSDLTPEGPLQETNYFEHPVGD